MKLLKQYLLFVFQDRIAYGQQPQYKWLFSIFRQQNALKFVFYLRNIQYFSKVDNHFFGGGGNLSILEKEIQFSL